MSNTAGSAARLGPRKIDPRQRAVGFGSGDFIVIYDLNAQTSLHGFKVSFEYEYVAVSHDYEWTVVTGDNPTRMYKVGETSWVAQYAAGATNACGWTMEDEYLFFLRQDGDIGYYERPSSGDWEDIPTEQTLSVANELQDYAFTPDGSELIVCDNTSGDGDVHIIDPQSWSVTRTINVSGQSYSVDMTLDGETLAVGDHNGNIRIINYDTGNVTQTIDTGTSQEIDQISIHPNGDDVGALIYEDGIYFYDTDTGNEIDSYTPTTQDAGYVEAFVYDKTGYWVIVGRGSYEIEDVGTIGFSPRIHKRRNFSNFDVAGLVSNNYRRGRVV